MQLFNKQAVLHKVYNALWHQGTAAVNVDGACAYRTRNNCKCAIGHLISDDNYSRDLEARGMEDDEVIEAVEKSLDVDLKNDFIGLTFLEEIQGIHDDHLQYFDHPDDFRKELTNHFNKIAERYNIYLELEEA